MTVTVLGNGLGICLAFCAIALLYISPLSTRGCGFCRDLSCEAFEVDALRSLRALRSQRGVLEHRWLGAAHPAGTPGHMTCLRGTAVSRSETRLMSLIIPRVIVGTRCSNCGSTVDRFFIHVLLGTRLV